MLELTSKSWVGLQGSGKDTILYYTALVSYRCGIREFRIGIDSTIPDRTIALPPCNERNPINVPRDTATYLKVAPTTALVSVELTYQDGSVSETKMFRLHRPDE